MTSSYDGISIRRKYTNFPTKLEDTFIELLFIGLKNKSLTKIRLNKHRLSIIENF